MADEVMFEVNAGLILAKLHLGCKEMFKKVTFYNSGIVGKDDGTPENPGKCTFDLKNIKDQYEIACELETYKVLKTLTNVQILKIVGKAIRLENEDENKYKKDKALLEEDLKAYLPSKDNTFNGLILGTAEVYKKDWIDEIAKPQLQQAFKYLQDYLTNFCGKENASKLTLEQLVPFFIDSPFDYKYDKYTIPESKNIDLINKLVEKFDKAFEEDIKKITNITDAQNYVKNDLPEFIKKHPIDIKGLKFKRAYKIGYSVDLEIA